ncbi:MAG: hypothetical protein M0017_10155 [Desulfobacteraceae bacterium]|nr:hypothetical protein [Desulfobacteraceae bacterium]
MKTVLRLRLPAFLCLAIWLLAIAGCIPGPSLRLARTAPPENGGLYSLILYGGVGHDDFETLAVMDREGDPYRIVSWTGDIGVEEREHLTAAEAFREAKAFLGNQNTFRSVETLAITGPDGQVIGYELRPLFWLAGAGGEAIDTSYVLGKNDVVTFYVFLYRRFWKNTEDQEEHGLLIGR